MKSFFLVSLLCVAGVAFATEAPGVSADSATGSSNQAHDLASAVDEFSNLDTNHDGVLSKAEMVRHPKAAHMAMVDENRDGVLSRDEFAELDDM